MKKIICLIILSLPLTIPIVSSQRHVCFTELLKDYKKETWLVPYSTKTPILDGNIGSLEWSDANMYNVNAYATFLNCYDSVTLGCYACHDEWWGTAESEMPKSGIQDFFNVYIKHDREWVYFGFKLYDKTYQPYTDTGMLSYSGYKISVTDRFYMGWDNGQIYPLSFMKDGSYSLAGETGCEQMEYFPNISETAMTSYNYKDSHWELEFRVPKPKEDVKMRIVYVNADGSTKALSDLNRYCDSYLSDCEWHGQYPYSFTNPVEWEQGRDLWQPLDFEGITEPEIPKYIKPQLLDIQETRETLNSIFSSIIQRIRLMMCENFNLWC